MSGHFRGLLLPASPVAMQHKNRSANLLLLASSHNVLCRLFHYLQPGRFRDQLVVVFLQRARRNQPMARVDCITVCDAWQLSYTQPKPCVPTSAPDRGFHTMQCSTPRLMERPVWIRGLEHFLRHGTLLSHSRRIWVVPLRLEIRGPEAFIESASRSHIPSSLRRPLLIQNFICWLIYPPLAVCSSFLSPLSSPCTTSLLASCLCLAVIPHSSSFPSTPTSIPARAAGLEASGNASMGFSLHSGVEQLATTSCHLLRVSRTP